MVKIMKLVKRWKLPDSDTLFEQYIANGYCIVRNLIPKKIINNFLEIYKKTIINSKNPVILPQMNTQKINKIIIKNGVMQSVIADIHQVGLFNKKFRLLNKRALQIILNNRILKILKALHKEKKYNLLMSMFFDQNAGTPAHQDSYYLDSMPSGHLTAAWIACEKIDTRAGRFYVIKKSNNLNIKLSKQEIINPNKYESKIFTLLKKNKLKTIAPALDIGDVVFWNSNTIHGSKKTLNQKYTRKSFTCHFIPNSKIFVRNKYNQEVRNKKGFKYNQNFNCRITGSLSLKKNNKKYISRSERNFNKQEL